MWAWSGRTRFRVPFLLAAVVAVACASSEKGGDGGSAGDGSGGDGGSGLSMTGGSSSGTAGDGARGGSATGGDGGTAPSGGSSGSSASGGTGESGGTGARGGTGGSGGPPMCPEDEPRGPPPSFTPPDCAIPDTTLLCEYDTMPDGGVTCRASYRCQCLSDHMGGVDCWWTPAVIACPDGGT